jgi:hypothetical protein
MYLDINIIIWYLYIIQLALQILHINSFNIFKIICNKYLIINMIKSRWLRTKNIITIHITVPTIVSICFRISRNTHPYYKMRSIKCIALNSNTTLLLNRVINICINIDTKYKAASLSSSVLNSNKYIESANNPIFIITFYANSYHVKLVFIIWVLSVFIS